VPTRLRLGVGAAHRERVLRLRRASDDVILDIGAVAEPKSSLITGRKGEEKKAFTQSSRNVQEEVPREQLFILKHVRATRNVRGRAGKTLGFASAFDSIEVVEKLVILVNILAQTF
jgi:hypothetical protein